MRMGKGGVHASVELDHFVTFRDTFLRHHAFEWSYARTIVLSIRRKVNADTLASLCPFAALGTLY
jgi:hypothetical protein